MQAPMTFPFQLGEERISLDISGAGASHTVFVNLHENEQSSVMAAKTVLAECPGTLAELRSRQERLIQFKLGDRIFCFDPNRMFSAAGIKASLEEYSVYSPAAASVITEFRDALLKVVQSTQPQWIIALHNTSGLYSIENYIAGGADELDAAAVFVNPERARADFFFTSDEAAFEFLKQKGFNAVLQNNSAVRDDGSLSVYCARHGIRYVNAEALHGHQLEQEEMLRCVYDFTKTN